VFGKAFYQMTLTFEVVIRVIRELYTVKLCLLFEQNDLRL